LIADSHGESAGPNLTDRELQVLQLIAQGLQFKEIASKLLLSTHTVRDYARSLFSKLDVNDRAGAVAVGFKTGILT
jgi:DNA-binding NarL/FixJ family response regulator